MTPDFGNPTENRNRDKHASIVQINIADDMNAGKSKSNRGKEEKLLLVWL